MLAQTDADRHRSLNIILHLFTINSSVVKKEKIRQLIRCIFKKCNSVVQHTNKIFCYDRYHSF